MKDYKKILEGVVNIINTAEKSDIGFTNICTYIGENCPELAEREDEKIKKEITELVMQPTWKTEKEFYRRKELCDWLEKQGSEPNWCHHKVDLSNCSEEYRKAYYDGWNNCNQQHEQCNAEHKLEPKFKVGDWVVWDNKISCHIDNIYQGKESLMYTITDTNNMIRSYSVKGFDNNAHLWTLQDAKPGNVLAFADNNIVMFKNLYNETTFHSYYHIEDGLFDVNRDEMPDWWEGKGFHPATKEQRDTLFAKMREAGYEWDANNKEVKLLITNGGDFFESENCEQNPTEWSHEDDVMVNDILRCLPVKSRPEFNQRRADWIKSIKSRVQSQPKQEWKQENREELTEFENAMMHIGGSFFGENAGLDPNDTDTIKEQAELLLELAPKTEWSEEDESMYVRTLGILGKCYMGELPTKVEEELKWFKSLKHQKKWKPSYEQLEALWCAAEKELESDEPNVVELRGKVLESLYNDLKKLME